jgi:ketosteroid isomerase-like protein
MNRRAIALSLVVPTVWIHGETSAQADLGALQREVWDTEVGFARSMAERDLAAFERYLSPHTVFWSDGKVLRGKAAVVQSWRRFFEDEQAPFSWQPDEVVVIGDGQLAQSTGPVHDAAGKLIARFVRCGGASPMAAG